VGTLVEPPQLERQSVERRSCVVVSDVGDEIVVNDDRGVVSVTGPFATRPRRFATRPRGFATRPRSFGNGHRSLAGASRRASSILPTQQADRDEQQPGDEQRQSRGDTVEYEPPQHPKRGERDRADGSGSTVHRRGSDGQTRIRPGRV
jgi:hypothetical protein